MGFFSWNCKACGHSILSNYAADDTNRWMTQAVVLTSGGEVCRGEYDGYGNCGSWNHDDGEPEMYHEACWKIAGSPMEYTEASKSSRDQGYFFDDNMHNLPEPQNARELEMVKSSGVLAELNCQQQWEISHLEYLISRVHEVVMSGKETNSEELIKIRKDIERHIDNRTRKENQNEADRLGLSFDDLMELSDKLRNLMPEDADDFNKQRPTHRFDKAEKLENGYFRLTTSNECVFDRDFENNKVYMVDDFYEGEIPSGTELSEWPEYMKAQITY